MSGTARLPSIGRVNDRAAVRRLRFGDVALTYVVDGVVRLRASAFFPDVPAEQWQPWPELFDGPDVMVMSAGGLLVERGERALLIDAGLGRAVPELPFGSADGGSMLQVLESLGRQPDDIDVVAFTHLHFDHAGWAFTDRPDGSQRKTFPRARYVVSGQELEPQSSDAMSERFIQPMAEVAIRISGGEEVFPGVRALASPGHTPGHMAYLIDAGIAGRVIVVGDAFHTPAQIAHPEWSSVADYDVAQATAARRAILTELTRAKTVAFVPHFGDQPFGRVTTADARGPHWHPIPSTVVGRRPRT
jgi:glyoxylase-like metal-dependent hydrolase (beta-lactamase superfamily II)